MSSQPSLEDVSVLKFTELKVDVTSLVNKPARPIVVVVSKVTKSRDVVKMVAQKLRMDQQDMVLMQLVAVVNYRSDEMDSDHGGCTQLVFHEDERPLSIYNEHPKECVRFYVQRRHADGVIRDNGNSAKSNITQTAAPKMATSGPVVLDSSLRYSAPASTLPGGHKLLTSSRAPAVASHGQQAMLPWQRRCAEKPKMMSAGDRLMHHEPCGGSVRDIHRQGDQQGFRTIAQHVEDPSAEERLRDPHSFRSPHGLRDPHGRDSSSGSLQGDIRHRGSHYCSSDTLNEHAGEPAVTQGLSDPHGFRKSRELCNRQGLNDDPKDLRFHHTQRLHDPYGFSNPCAPHDPQERHHSRGICNSQKFRDPQRLHDPPEFCRSRGSDSGRPRMDRRSDRRDDLYRPHSNLAATATVFPPDVSDVTSKDNDGGRVTSMSVGSMGSVERPLVKFFSLPDVDEIQRQAGTGSDVSQLWDSVFESKRLDGPSTFVSMPCISSHHHGRGRRLTPKRFLPTLSISKEAVEAKRKSMSSMLLERLHQISDKRKHSNTTSSKSRFHNGKQTAAAAVTSSAKTSRREARHNSAAATATAAVAIDDDCMSVTSREVAIILSTAGPMAPPSDDDDNCTEYADDDVSELEVQHQRLSSAMQLLRVSSRSSSSSPNASTGTSVSPATLPRRRNIQLTPFRRPSNTAQLNNVSSGRRADEFRPNMNGVCNMAVDRKDQLDLGQMNGGLRSTVGSVGGLHRQHPALFDLLRTHCLFALTLEFRLQNGHHIRGPPFQLVNDVIYIPADNTASRCSRRHTGLKLTVPIVTTLVAKYRKDWLMTSSECIQPGDVIVEVNGLNVLSGSAVTVLDLVVSSTCLDIVVARPR